MSILNSLSSMQLMLYIFCSTNMRNNTELYLLNNQIMDIQNVLSLQFS